MPLESPRTAGTDAGPAAANGVQQVFAEGLAAIHQRADQFLVWIILADWLMAVALSGLSMRVALAGLFNLPVAVLVAERPGWKWTRHAVAVTLTLWSGVLVQITGGRVETHFHLFATLACLAFYRDWRVILTALGVAAADQSTRFALWPASVYGLATPSPWLLAEHVTWLTFEGVILMVGCVRSHTALRGTAQREAALARSNGDIEREVQKRTAELADANASLQAEMTARLQVETDLRQAHKLESVGRLASGVAHEINTPIQFVNDSVHFLQDATQDLMTVIGYLREVEASVLAGAPSREAAEAAATAASEADLDYLVEHMPKAIDRALDGLNRVATIVRSMKEFAHPDTVEMAPIDLNRAVESTLVIARNEYKYVAEVETDFGPLPPVRCHAGDVNQAVLNIVVNAAHAIADVVAGTNARGRITVRTRLEPDDVVVVSIADTGAGIPEAIRDRIFDPFFTTKEVGRGTGQGLAIARTVIVDRHHGELTFESEVGRGTTCFLRLPVHGRAVAKSPPSPETVVAA